MKVQLVKDGIYKVINNNNSFQLEAISESEAISKYQEGIINAAKSNKISEVKKECERLIESDNWRIERYDFQKRIGAETSETETVINNLLTQFENYRKQSNTMEAEINALTTEEEVKNYKVNFS